jgi:hypothetical protein
VRGDVLHLGNTLGWAFAASASFFEHLHDGLGFGGEMLMVISGA